ncbi:hypothetical protein B2J93_6296 [Marssonina coronariae]|uniref:Uncharacterized protein n=1 Tax=Diplocarpon coronariae TaxID=2795749 RepID=A0A218ZE07_9HELO|nr:hypothetical protein B2J93_6296 [Marssonina coronariae]
MNSTTRFNEKGTPHGGFNFGQTSQDSATPSRKRHQEDYPDSYHFMTSQETYAKIKREIADGFHGEEQRKFEKQWTKLCEKKCRKAAKLDLDMENNKELKQMSERLEISILGKRKGLMADLESEQKKVKSLERHLLAAEKEIEELKGKIKSNHHTEDSAKDAAVVEDEAQVEGTRKESPLIVEDDLGYEL